MAIQKRSDGKLALTTEQNRIIDVVNGLGRLDVIKSGHMPEFGRETALASPTKSLNDVDGSQGFYRGKFKIDSASPQSGGIASSDLGDDSDNNDVIIANLAEINSDSSGLAADGSEVVFGVIVGFNDIDNGGVGSNEDDGLPVLATYVAYDIGTVKEQVKKMLSDNQSGWGLVCFV